MSEKLATLEKKGGSSGSGSVETVQDFCYHKVFDNNYTALTSSDVYQGRCTINNGGYFEDNGHGYIYVDMTIGGFGANDSWLLIVNIPSSTTIYCSLNTNYGTIETVTSSSGRTGKGIRVTTKSGGAIGAGNLICYGQLY